MVVEAKNTGDSYPKMRNSAYIFSGDLCAPMSVIASVFRGAHVCSWKMQNP